MLKDKDPFHETYTLIAFTQMPARSTQAVCDETDPRIVSVAPWRRWILHMLALVAVGAAARLLGFLRTA